MAPAPVHDLYDSIMTYSDPSPQALPASLSTRFESLSHQRALAHGPPLSRHPRQHRRQAPSMPLSALAKFYTAELPPLIPRDGPTFDSMYPSQNIPLPASLIRTPVILSAVAIGLVFLVTGLRFLLRSRKQSALRRLMLNPKHAEDKLRFTIVNPVSRTEEKTTTTTETPPQAKVEVDRGTIGRIKSLLSQIHVPLSHSSLDEYLNERYPRRPQPAFLRREIFVRRHSLNITRSKGTGEPVIPSSLRPSAVPPAPALYTISEDDNYGRENRDSNAVRSSHKSDKLAQTLEAPPSLSADLIDATGTLDISPAPLESFETISLDVTTASHSALPAALPRSTIHSSAARSHFAGSRIGSGLRNEPTALSLCSSVTSVDVSEADACVIRRAQSLRVNYERGTTIYLAEDMQSYSSEIKNQVYTGIIDTLPSVVVTNSADATDSREILAPSAASSTVSVTLDDFPTPPSLCDTPPSSQEGVSLTGTPRLSRPAGAEAPAMCKKASVWDYVLADEGAKSVALAAVARDSSIVQAKVDVHNASSIAIRTMT